MIISGGFNIYPSDLEARAARAPGGGRGGGGRRAVRAMGRDAGGLRRAPGRATTQRPRSCARGSTTASARRSAWPPCTSSTNCRAAPSARCSSASCASATRCTVSTRRIAESCQRSLTRFWRGHGLDVPVFRDRRPGRDEARAPDRRGRPERRRRAGVRRPRHRQVDRRARAGRAAAADACGGRLPPIGCDPRPRRLRAIARRGAPAARRCKSHRVPVPVVDLPLGATEDRVVGALDLERALAQGEKAFEPGLLARAHRGFLYIDEVNLLEDHLVDLLLDVAASGENVVEREGLSVRHPARFVLVGSGNPEEGELRPQLLDRFGLSVEVRTPTDLATRIEVVRRRDAFERDPAGLRRALGRRTRPSCAGASSGARARCATSRCRRCRARARGAALHGARHRRPARRAHADPRRARAGGARGRRRGRPTRTCAASPRRRCATACAAIRSTRPARRCAWSARSPSSSAPERDADSGVTRA